MTTILLVRHGQSAANLAHIFAGHSHFPLSELGVKQAEKTAAYIEENFKVDAIFSSDLLRAFNTACCISERLGMLEIITDPGLREEYAGDWEGKTMQELETEYPEQFRLWKERIGECCPEGGEPLRELAVRAKNTVLRIALENDGKTIVMTSHAAFIRSLETIVRYGNTDKMHEIPWATNASVSIYQYQNGEITSQNYSIDEHLEEYKQKTLMESGRK